MKEEEKKTSAKALSEHEGDILTETPDNKLEDPNIKALRESLNNVFSGISEEDENNFVLFAVGYSKTTGEMHVGMNGSGEDLSSAVALCIKKHCPYIIGDLLAKLVYIDLIEAGDSLPEDCTPVGGGAGLPEEQCDREEATTKSPETETE